MSLSLVWGNVGFWEKPRKGLCAWQAGSGDTEINFTKLQWLCCVDIGATMWIQDILDTCRKSQLFHWIDRPPPSPAPLSRTVGLKEGIPAWHLLPRAQPARTQPVAWDTRLWNPPALSSCWEPRKSAVPQARSLLLLNRRKIQRKGCFKQVADR